MQAWIDVQDPETQAVFRERAATADIVYVEGVHSAEALGILAQATEKAPTFVAFDCAPALHALGRLGGLASVNPGYTALLTSWPVSHFYMTPVINSTCAAAFVDESSVHIWDILRGSLTCHWFGKCQRQGGMEEDY